MAKSWSADELYVAGLIGSVEGEFKVDPFLGFCILESIDWERSTFCLDDDPEGNPLEISEFEKQQISEEISELLENYEVGEATGRIFLRQKNKSWKPIFVEAT